MESRERAHHPARDQNHFASVKAHATRISSLAVSCDSNSGGTTVSSEEESVVLVPLEVCCEVCLLASADRRGYDAGDRG